MIKALILYIFNLTILVSLVFAGNERQLLRQGNKLFENEDYVAAEQKYRDALDINSENLKAWHNLGNTLYRQGRLEEAKDIFSQLTREGSAPQDFRAAGWHNLGNALLGSGQIPESVDAFKEALRLSPTDDDTRYNLAYALNLLEEMPPDATDQNGQGEDDDDQQEQEQDPGPDQDHGDDDQSSDPSPGMDPDEGDDQLAERPDRLSPRDAERILEALKQQEQKIQENIDREEQVLEPIRSQREW